MEHFVRRTKHYTKVSEIPEMPVCSPPQNCLPLSPSLSKLGHRRQKPSQANSGDLRLELIVNASSSGREIAISELTGASS